MRSSPQKYRPSTLDPGSPTASFLETPGGQLVAWHSSYSSWPSDHPAWGSKKTSQNIIKHHKTFPPQFPVPLFMAVFPKAWPLWNFGASFGHAAAGLMDSHDAWGHQYVVMDLLKGKLHNFSGRITHWPCLGVTSFLRLNIPSSSCGLPKQSAIMEHFMLSRYVLTAICPPGNRPTCPSLYAHESAQGGSGHSDWEFGES